MVRSAGVARTRLRRDPSSCQCQCQASWSGTGSRTGGSRRSCRHTESAQSAVARKPWCRSDRARRCANPIAGAPTCPHPRARQRHEEPSSHMAELHKVWASRTRVPICWAGSASAYTTGMRATRPPPQRQLDSRAGGNPGRAPPESRTEVIARLHSPRQRGLAVADRPTGRIRRCAGAGRPLGRAPPGAGVAPVSGMHATHGPYPCAQLPARKRQTRCTDAGDRLRLNCPHARGEP